MEFYAARYLNIIRELEECKLALFDEKMPVPDGKIPFEFLSGWLERFQVLEKLLSIRVDCEESDLGAAIRRVDGLMQYFANGKVELSYIRMMVGFIEQEIIDGLSASVFIRVPTDKLDYYRAAYPFGDEVSAKFPKMISDIEGAAKCLALGRYTATVFHLMRVMELGVRYFGQKLGVPKTDEIEWQPILDRLNGAINKLGIAAQGTKLSAAQKEERDRYAKAVVYLENVKNAWRNNVMHPKGHYDNEEATEVFKTVRHYIRYLVDIL